MSLNYKTKTLFYPGHTACAGCGQNLAARHVINAFGPNTIVVNATGCLEVTTTKFGESAWGVPYIHSLFENPAAVASGILAALKYRLQITNHKLQTNSKFQIPKNKIENCGIENSLKIENCKLKIENNPKVIVLAGDGSTYDIGFGILAGMFERMDDITYVCFDNEGYQNTGGQYSGSSPLGAETTTTPIGKNSEGADEHKKNMPAFAVSQGLEYVATSSVAYPEDIVNKIKKSFEFKGPKYIQILVTCVPGWGTDSKDTIKIARLAVETGFYPVMEIIKGKITKVIKVPALKPKIEEYLKLQDRFKHLFKDEEGKKIIRKLQKICDQNIEVYGLCPTCEDHKVLTHYRDIGE